MVTNPKYVKEIFGIRYKVNADHITRPKIKKKA